MTATATRGRIDMSNIDPIDPDSIVVNPLPSGNGVIGWFCNREDGAKERIDNPVFAGQASPLFGSVPRGLWCNEDGSWC